MMIRIGRRDIFRYVVSWAVLYVCWLFLARWYTYEAPWDYLIFFGLLTVFCRWVGWPLLRNHVQPAHFSRWILVGLLLLVALPWAEWLRLSTLATRERWTQQLFLQGVFIYVVLLFFGLFPAVPRFIHVKAASLFQFLSSRDFFLYLPCVLFFALTGWISVFVFQETPILPDSSAHLFQAKVLREGKLFAPAPPFADLFSGPLDLLVIREEKWFGIYPPGYALILAAAMFLRFEWLVSPLLGALTIAIWISYARRWHGRQVASLLGWLCLLSPFLMLMSSSIMVFSAELFLASAITYLCRRAAEETSAWLGVALFFFLAAAILVRSFSLLPFLVPMLLYVCWRKIHVHSFWILAATILGLGAGVSLLMYYQSQTTGDPFLPGYLVEFPDIGWGFGQHAIGQHSLWKALENTSNNLLGLNLWLNGCYSGSLVFLIAFILLEPSIGKWDKILLLSCFLLIAFYFLFFFKDLWFSKR